MLPRHNAAAADRATQPSIRRALDRFVTRRSSIVVWLACVAYLALVALLLRTLLPVSFVDQAQAGFFEPAGITAIGVLGLLGVWLSTKTGFPDALDPRITWRRRFMLPTLVGLAAGSLFLFTDVATELSRLQREQFDLPATDIAFPASVLVYSAAAIDVEVVYRLLPIPLLLWLISNVLLRGRGQASIFWVLAMASSAIEPLSQAATLVVPLPLWFAIALQSFGVNLAQATMFRKYGFVAAIILRIAFYLVYHVLGAPLK